MSPRKLLLMFFFFLLLLMVLLFFVQFAPTAVSCTWHCRLPMSSKDNHIARVSPFIELIGARSIEWWQFPVQGYWNRLESYLLLEMYNNWYHWYCKPCFLLQGRSRSKCFTITPSSRFGSIQSSGFTASITATSG